MNALRMLFLSIAGVIALGIWLTGFDKAHWLLYVPVAFLTFAAVTGICPGLIFWSRLGYRNEPLSCELPGGKK
ncbi:MAG: hypothetical protein KJ634_09860 [Gammaproteobacteria bacterium]|nr:hypothetical protein [Gammaproteobacteria bacterium]MBU1415915.1 hypothetical protein [Gammaproteobacteria bacterium]